MQSLVNIILNQVQEAIESLEISKKVASLLVDSFVQGDDKLKGDSKIVADLAITGA